MKLSVDQLPSLGYTRFSELRHDEVVPFIQESMNRSTFYSYFYKLMIISLFGWLGYMITYSLLIEGWIAFIDLSKLLISLFLAVIIIPIHEWIHMAAYKISGARVTIFKSNWRKFYFIALADGFVTNVRTFKFVALAPFCILSCLALLSMLFIDPDWYYVPIGFLFFHSFACGGDFGLLSYITSYKNQDIVTYDDVQSGISYFYSKPK